ncbi:cytochrome c oxidase subunit 3 [Novosphingobium sp. 9U]|uniref:cytochrome c oxidase subunit 3 n=1 Tax=Novosphingobium sp. 9U TaxID=2653158 RepID=UPI0012F09BB7|nr:cytochrome c oxidase subunit 3 [Novosphingobium sp. 9U]VWX47349.1 Cytochrome c oxidase polypeptide III [Novosphingobium sp. 9U]
MTEAGQALHDPFTRLDRQREADRLGMLLFLASELMVFGGVFAGALSVRVLHKQQYIEASREMHLWLGAANTVVLLTSSLLVALAVEATRAGAPRKSGWLLGGAIGLGLAFLAIKAVEYGQEWQDGLVPRFHPAKLSSPEQTLFMTLYFIGTGLHAIHVLVGLALLAAMIWPRGWARADREATSLGNAALYWHFVDVVWIFLYPTLYLAR